MKNAKILAFLLAVIMVVMVPSTVFAQALQVETALPAVKEPSEATIENENDLEDIIPSTKPSESSPIDSGDDEEASIDAVEPTPSETSMEQPQMQGEADPFVMSAPQNDVITMSALQGILPTEGTVIETTTFIASATGVTGTGGVKKVAFAVWSEKEGHKSLQWYIGTQNGQDWWVEIDAANNHNKIAGVYHIHVFATDGAGVETKIGETKVTMKDDADKISATVRTESNRPEMAKKKFLIEAANFDVPSGITKVAFAVWSNTNGQDDLHWYIGKKVGDYFRAEVDMYNHNYLYDTYTVHAYATNGWGTERKAGEYSLEYKEWIPIKSIVPTNGTVITTQTFEVIALTDDLHSMSVMFGVWSDRNGQDDLTWYKGAPRVGYSDNYAVTIDIANHKYDTGTYHIHVYAAYDYYNEKKGGEIQVTVDYSTSQTKITPASGSILNTPKFQVAAKNTSGVGRVAFGVWSDKNGQDDLHWYIGNRNGTDWVANIDVANHKYDDGIYHIHVYATDNFGNETKFGEAEVTLVNDKQAPTAFDIHPRDGETINTAALAAWIYEVIDPSGVKEVSIAVWSEKGGQDDLQWYQAGAHIYGQPSQPSSWNTVIDLEDKHDISDGKFYVHIYATDGWGNQGKLGQRTITVNAKPTKPTMQNLLPEDKSTIGAAKFLTSATVSSSNGIRKVAFGVWSEKNGQDDLIWYVANYEDYYPTYINETREVNIAGHNNEAGVYNIHVYVTDAWGKESFVGASRFTINLQNGGQRPTMQRLTPEPGTTASYSSVHVRAEGIYSYNDIKEVAFAVWSEKNGQDDLKWHVPELWIENGAYSTAFNLYFSEHNLDEGVYHVHVYGTDVYGNKSLMGKTTIIVPKDNQPPKCVSIYPGSGSIITTESVDIIANIQDQCGVKNVSIAIWSAIDGQDDLIWYQPGYWQGHIYAYHVNLNTANHKNDKGLYYIHIYAEDNKGNSGKIGEYTLFMQ